MGILVKPRFSWLVPYRVENLAAHKGNRFWHVVKKLQAGAIGGHSKSLRHAATPV